MKHFMDGTKTLKKLNLLIGNKLEQAIFFLLNKIITMKKQAAALETHKKQ